MTLEKNSACLSVQLYFAQPGSIERITGKDCVLQMEGVADFRCHYKVGDCVPQTENASARAGFCLIYGDNETDICHKISNFYKHFKIISKRWGQPSYKRMQGESLVEKIKLEKIFQSDFA